MKFEDLSMTLEQVVDFAKNHNMFIAVSYTHLTLPTIA